VHADGDAARAGGEVVARERALPALVEAHGVVERERVRRDDLAGEEMGADVDRHRGACSARAFNAEVAEVAEQNPRKASGSSRCPLRPRRRKRFTRLPI